MMLIENGKILTKEQIAEAKKAAEPLAQWLADNCHPHVTAIVDSTSLEIVEGLAVVKLDTRLRD